MEAKVQWAGDWADDWVSVTQLTADLRKRARDMERELVGTEEVRQWGGREERAARRRRASADDEGVRGGED